MLAVFEIYRVDCKKLVRQQNGQVFSKQVVTKLELAKYVRIVAVVLLLFYVHGKHLRSCRDCHLT